MYLFLYQLDSFIFDHILKKQLVLNTLLDRLIRTINFILTVYLYIQVTSHLFISSAICCLHLGTTSKTTTTGNDALYRSTPSFAFHWRHSYRIPSQLNPSLSSPFTSGLAFLACGGDCIACWISFMRPMNPWRLRPTLSARSRRILKTRLLFSTIEGRRGWNCPLMLKWAVTLSCWSSE